MYSRIYIILYIPIIVELSASIVYSFIIMTYLYVYIYFYDYSKPISILHILHTYGVHLQKVSFYIYLVIKSCPPRFTYISTFHSVLCLEFAYIYI